MIKVSAGLYMHIGTKFTVNKLNGSDSTRSNLLILPNYASTIFALAILLRIARIEWINARYFAYVPLHLRTMCNIATTLYIAAYVLNSVWIALMSGTRLACMILGPMVNDAAFIEMPNRVSKHGEAAIENSSLVIAASFFIVTLRSIRTMFQCSTSDGIPARKVERTNDDVPVQKAMIPVAHKTRRKRRT